MLLWQVHTICNCNHKFLLKHYTVTSCAPPLRCNYVMQMQPATTDWLAWYYRFPIRCSFSNATGSCMLIVSITEISDVKL